MFYFSLFDEDFAFFFTLYQKKLNYDYGLEIALYDLGNRFHAQGQNPRGVKSDVRPKEHLNHAHCMKSETAVSTHATTTDPRLRTDAARPRGASARRSRSRGGPSAKISKTKTQFFFSQTILLCYVILNYIQGCASSETFILKHRRRKWNLRTKLSAAKNKDQTIRELIHRGHGQTSEPFSLVAT